MSTWNDIKTNEDIERIISASNDKPQVIFKDSVTCGISAYAKERLNSGINFVKDKATLNYLDLLNHRSVSSFIADRLNVIHQSPQIIIVKNEKVTYTVTHHSIDPETIAKELD